jgi:protein-S-isoprenylcysteine O-methyltransferase Ste14
MYLFDTSIRHHKNGRERGVTQQELLNIKSAVLVVIVVIIVVIWVSFMFKTLNNAPAPIVSFYDLFSLADFLYLLTFWRCSFF